jgi:hypothetical protein
MVLKNFPYGKIGISYCMQTWSGFYNARQYRRNNILYAIAVIGYANHTLWVEGSNPSPVNGIAQQEEQQSCAGSNPASALAE